MNYWADADELKIYLQEIERYPLLNREQEIELANRFRDSQDAQAVNDLITSNLRFVIKVALGYRNYGIKGNGPDSGGKHRTD